VAVPPSGLIATTSNAPAAWAGTVAEIELELLTLTLWAGTLPITTAAPDTKPEPPMVTAEPPAVPAEAGDTDVIDGVVVGLGPAAVVKLQTWPVAVILAMVLSTIFQR